MKNVFYYYLQAIGRDLTGERKVLSTFSKRTASQQSEKEWVDDILDLYGKFYPEISVFEINWVDIDSREKSGIVLKGSWVENKDVGKVRLFNG